MKRLSLLLVVPVTALLAPAAFAAAPARTDAAAPAHINDTSKIPPELCLAVLGSDFERLVCSG